MYIQTPLMLQVRNLFIETLHKEHKEKWDITSSGRAFSVSLERFLCTVTFLCLTSEFIGPSLQLTNIPLEIKQTHIKRQ